MSINTTKYVSTHTRPRSLPPLSIVLHDTVTHSASAAHRVLEQQKYSTHYLVDLDGTVYQSADPATQTAVHCGGNNDRSIGLDVVAILDPKLANAGEVQRKVNRPWSVSKVVGKVIDYTPQQYGALVGLVEHLCATFGIPRTVPHAFTSRSSKVPGLTPAYRGVLAHGQWSTSRWDGFLAVEALIARGFADGTP